MNTFFYSPELTLKREREKKGKKKLKKNGFIFKFYEINKEMHYYEGIFISAVTTHIFFVVHYIKSTIL